MIPWRVETPGRVVPLLTMGLILINGLFYMFATVRFPLEVSVLVYGVMGADASLSSSLTSMFMHAGWGHLLGNMFFLWLFGKAVEDDLGPWVFVGFYLLAGFTADAGQLLIGGGLDGTIPMVGASGAVAGVMAGYLVLFPKAEAQVIVLGRLAWLTRVLRGEGGYMGFHFYDNAVIRAYWLILYHIGMDLLGGLGSLGGAGGGTAHWAHLGGYAGGAVMGLVLKPRLRTGMEMKHMVVRSPSGKESAVPAPDTSGLQAPAAASPPGWVNWQAVNNTLAQGEWPPKVMELAAVGDKETLVPLLQRMLGHFRQQGDGAKVQEIRGILRLLGVRLPGL